MDLRAKEQLEIEFWKTSQSESPEHFSKENLENKKGDALVFESLLAQYISVFDNASDIIEIGAGQGWASCIIKKRFPDKKVTTTDISEWAIASLKYWEEIYQVKVDEVYAAKSYQLATEDNSTDLVFCFSAAHHFVLYNETLKEIQRVLKPGGICLWLYEPLTPSIFYKIIKRRLNKVRQVVPEDVIIKKNIRTIASNANLELQIDYFPSLIKRGPLEKYYFGVLNRLTFLNRLLPTTANLLFTKPAY